VNVLPRGFSEAIVGRLRFELALEAGVSETMIAVAA
jgi:hypothetical protein